MCSYVFKIALPYCIALVEQAEVWFESVTAFFLRVEDVAVQRRLCSKDNCV